MLLKNEWVNHEIEEEIKKYMEANENENTIVQTLWDATKAVLRGKYIAIQAYPGLSQETNKKFQIQNLIAHLKELRSRTTKKPQSQQKKRNNKDQSRNKEYRIKKETTVEQINETKRWFFEKNKQN